MVSNASKLRFTTDLCAIHRLLVLFSAHLDRIFLLIAAGSELERSYDYLATRWKEISQISVRHWRKQDVEQTKRTTDSSVAHHHLYAIDNRSDYSNVIHKFRLFSFIQGRYVILSLDDIVNIQIYMKKCNLNMSMSMFESYSRTEYSHVFSVFDYSPWLTIAFEVSSNIFRTIQNLVTQISHLTGIIRRCFFLPLVHWFIVNVHWHWHRVPISANQCSRSKIVQTGTLNWQFRKVSEIISAIIIFLTADNANIILDWDPPSLHVSGEFGTRGG